ncbi:type II toxin-antitoxin system HicA family toxin [Parahaliea mediterranea]|uniref:Type II toxin-antitoxin system HicA family toxin n=1 Tax=Parahaliea mediterranea TaxID=651086 RepID=A0A939IMF1_9GAMM|nr:type II toxin-antitoxin system HicA family toxin [Parahaliea mediterranea]
MNKRQRRTLTRIYSRPVSGSIPWKEIESLLQALGAEVEVEERAGSRVAVVWKDEVRVFHRPHPSPDTDKGAVASVKKWLESHGVTP